MAHDNRPARVLILSDATPERNGVGSYYADLVNQLRPHVDQIELLHPLSKRAGGYRYLTAPLPGDRTQKVAIPNVSRLLRVIREVKPTAIIVPTPGPFGLAGLCISRWMGIPLLVGFHTHYEALANIYWKNALGKGCQSYLSWFNRLLFRHSALVLANSPDMQNQASLLGATDVQLMGTSIAQDFLDSGAQALPRQSQELRSVIFAGRLAKEKNLAEFFKAADAHPDIQFGIAGDGPQSALVEQRCKTSSNLRWYGWVDRAELPTLIDAHDLLLLPSHVESFGTVALEAMARGRLVAVSSRCGISEWPQLKDALVVIQSDETAADALRRVRRLSPEDRLQIAQQARENAVQLHEWNRQRWLGWLNSVPMAA